MSVEAVLKFLAELLLAKLLSAAAMGQQSTGMKGRKGKLLSSQ